MATKPVRNGAPTNGSIPFNPSKTTFDGKDRNVTRSAIGLPKSQSSVQQNALQWSKKKTDIQSNTPSELFSKHFGGKTLSQAEMITRSLDEHALAIPQRVIGLLNIRIKGAETRIGTRKTQIQVYRVALKTGRIEKSGKVISISPDERKTIRDKKLHTEAELLKAKEDLRMLRGYLEEAMIANSSPTRDNIKSVRELKYIQRMAPSISKRIIEKIESNPETKQKMIELTKDGDAAKGFLDILKGGDPKSHKLLLNKSKLATQVRSRVFEQITK